MAVYHFEGVPRGPVAVAIKNLLTLGIHTKLWLYRINREMDGHEGFHIDLRWLGVMVALPIVTPIIVKFQTARRLNQMVSHQVTQPIVRARRLGWISIVPVFGAGFYAWWVQTTLNRHWFHHRREERIHLAEDRIARLGSTATGADADKRRALEEDVRRMRHEIDEEIEAARIRWGEERFADRMKRAELHAAQGGRMSRKDLQRLRDEEKAHRKDEKARRKAARGRLFGLLPARPHSEEEEGAWRPRTAPPERTPEEVRAIVAREGREPTKEEKKEIARAEKTLARIEKERAAHEKAVEKARAKRDKADAKREAAAERKRLQEEKAKAKADKAKEKATPGGKKPGKRRKGAPPPAPIAVQARRVRAPDTVLEVGAGPLRLMAITCPRCKTRIDNVQKRGDAPAKVTCPTCGLVGKV